MTPVQPAAVVHRSRTLNYAYRFPKTTAILTQSLFWVLWNTMLVLVLHLVARAMMATSAQPSLPSLAVLLAFSTLLSVGYGSALGLIDVALAKTLSRQLSLGTRILLKAVAYSLAYLLIGVVFIAALEHFAGATDANGASISMTDGAHFQWVLALTPTTIVGNLVVGYMKLVDRSFGPGLLIALLLGRYRRPVWENRVFMFMDLKSSTTHAERLGPERYSAMMRDLFNDVDRVVPRFDAEIHQYAGDEVVFTWSTYNLKDKNKCLKFYFAVQRSIEQRSAHYLSSYGVVPEFKAGAHVGDVIAVEIGEIKREIAYHGDTVNTAARIQAMCNKLGRSLLVSEELWKQCALGDRSPLTSEPIGKLALKGKRREVRLVAILQEAAPGANAVAGNNEPGAVGSWTPNALEELVNSSKEHVLQHVAEHFDRSLSFHNEKHFARVAASVEELAARSGVGMLDRAALRLAAWFHDTGYHLGAVG
ncbi:MAG TPA: adenylate/guanylate cyclase domain-containing protein, partial [Flavobacteriales bacterium]|nr:adenylate/guanylate cyclase domain-containing protein [Flavobacteriales bacterium]